MPDLRKTNVFVGRPQVGRAGIGVCALAALFFLVNLQVVDDWMTYSFDDGTYSHAYLIPFMSLFLLYRAWQRDRLLPRYAPAVWALMLLSLFVYLWLEMAHQRFLARAMVPACLLLVLGAAFRINRYVVGAAALFWFATPIWGPANEFLQWSSVKAVAAIMSLTGIPTYVFGEFVQIPAGTFEIADGCSGLRYVIAMLTLVAFYGVLYMRHLWQLAVLFAVALLGAMLTNWLRIVALILIGHFSDMESSLVRDHNMFGWFLFFPLMLLIFRFADRLVARTGQLADAADSGAATVSSAPVSRWLLLVPLGVVALSGSTARLAQGESAFSLPAQLDVDSAEPLAMDTVAAPLVYAAQDVEFHRHPGGVITYRVDFAGTIDAQRVEFYLNDVVPAGWKEVGSRREDSAVELELRRGNGRALLRFAYGIDGEYTGSATRLRMLRLEAALRLHRESQLLWAFVPCESVCGDRERSRLARRFEALR